MCRVFVCVHVSCVCARVRARACVRVTLRTALRLFVSVANLGNVCACVRARQAWTSSPDDADAVVVEAPVEPDMFVMAMRWAPSTCAFQPDARACAGYQYARPVARPRACSRAARMARVRRRRGVQQSHTFSLAGFWPENHEKGLLLSCSNDKFSTRAIAHLIGRLRMAWPSFSRFSDPTGWSREWGACAAVRARAHTHTTTTTG
jgi:ribonuclease I